MTAITIDDKARFLSVLSLNVDPHDASTVSREAQRAVEQGAPSDKGFLGAVVMANTEGSQLLVISLWESAHAWGAAQYDNAIGKAVGEVVETAKSYNIQTYETVTIVRA